MNFDYYIIQSGQAVPENPYEIKGSVYKTICSEDWNKFNDFAKSHTLPFIGSLPDGSRVKREDCELEAFYTNHGWQKAAFELHEYDDTEFLRLRLKEQPSPKMVDRDKVIALLEEAVLSLESEKQGSTTDHKAVLCGQIQGLKIGINKIKSL